MLWYESRRRGLGVEFVAVLDEAFERIAQRSEAGALWRSDRSYRKWIVRRFPYNVFYEVGEAVTVVAVAHQRRRPGYWIGR